MKQTFSGCKNLNHVWLDGINTSSVTDMCDLFVNCASIKQIDISHFDTSQVTDLSGLFSGCSSLEQVDISNFVTSQATDLGSLFRGCSSLEQVDITNFDTSQVIDMSYMFSGCKLLEEIDVSKLNTAKVISMSSMFAECESLTELDLSSFDMSMVYNTERMFCDCSALEKLDLGETVMGSLYNTQEMFRGCGELQELDLSTFDTSNVSNMEGMFRECRKVTELDVSHFDTSAVSELSFLFYGCESVKELDVTGFKTDKVTDMSCVFLGCASLKKLDVSSFDMSNVYNAISMFSGCSSLTDFTFGEDKDLGQILTATSMFEGCKSLETLDIDLYLPKVTRMDYCFKNCSSLTTLEDVDIRAYYLKSAIGMFQGCSSLLDETVSLGSPNLTDISYMFKDCTSLKRLSISFFNAYPLTKIDELCAGCSSLESIYFPRGEAEKIESMYSVFAGCSSLKGVDLSGFNTPNVTKLSQLFYKCSSLESVKMEVLKSDSVTSMFSMFEGCSSLKSIDLSQFEPKENSFTRNNFKDCIGLIEIQLTPSMMKNLVTGQYNNFDGCELFSEFHFDGSNDEWTAIRSLWQNNSEKKVKYASVHLNDGTIEQTLQHEGRFQYIKQGGVGLSESEMNAPENYIYNCDLSHFFGNSYSYNHNLGQMSIRVSMAAMSDNTNTNSSNIQKLMDDLNVSKKKIHYPVPEYNSIGYAMGTRRIYHNNQKKTLIMVAIRGGGYGSEWGGNANVGAGGEHEGFDLAATQVYEALEEYIAELRTCGFIEKDDKKIAVWISGYSRGAATANLLAAKLDDQYYMSTMLPESITADVKSENVFAFCFECPRNTVNQYHAASRYQNIFNIINPKDFVTYVAMNNGLDWRFNRYGKDLVLPDEANTKGSSYAGYYANMKNVYQAELEPEIGANQSVFSRDAAKRLGNIISKIEYLNYYQGEVQAIAVATMAKIVDIEKFLENVDNVLSQLFPILWKSASLEFDLLILEIVSVKDSIEVAHLPELCMAWMDSIPEEVLTKKKSFWNVFVNCPVDIYVYEGENLVGCIKNDVPQVIENGVITMLDSNGQKQVVLPGDGEYSVVYKATGDGTMTISTSKYIQTEAIPESVTGYYELPLKAGETYESWITESDFALSDSAKTVIKPSAAQSGADVKMYKVDIMVEGNGEASGINTYFAGEFSKVSAYPKDGEQFLGWYENGNLISGVTEYRFCVKKDTTLVAKFTQNDKSDDMLGDSEKEEQSVAAGTCYTLNKHTYKIINEKKKTVSFVKTSSNSKTIKIPATVTINGTKYNVTAIEANALKGNRKVTKISIGKNVTSIGKKAFYKCTSLKTITIPAKVKTIDESAFSGCKKLTKVTIGKGVTKIGKKAFYNCKKLKSVTLKTTKLKSVGKYAFKGIAKQAIIKCPAKKVKKYRKIIQKSEIAKTVQFK